MLSFDFLIHEGQALRQQFKAKAWEDAILVVNAVKVKAAER
jgi:hypothetical protein